MDAKDIRNKWAGKGTAKPVGRVGPDAIGALEKVIHKENPMMENQPPKIEAADLEIKPALPSPPSNEEITFEDILKGRFNPFMMYQIPVAWIDFNDSANYNRDAIEVVEKSEGFLSLVESIRDVGQKYPGVARVNKSGMLQITDGWRRALACRKGKIGTFLCLLSLASDVEAALESLALNLLREDLPEYKKLDEIKKLHDQFSLTYDEISRKTGFGSKGVISDSLLIYEYSDIEKPFREKKLTLNQARTLARLAKKEKLQPREISNLARQIEAKEIQLKELPFLVRKSAKKTAKPEKAEVYFFAQTKDGGLFYRCKLDPKRPNVGEWRKAIERAEELIAALKKAIKDR